MNLNDSQLETLMRTSLASAAEHDPVPPRPALPMNVSGQPRPRRPRSRRVTAAAVGAGLTLAVGGVAAASGFIPSVITRGFGTNMYGKSMRDARMVAQVLTPTGIAIQEWTGHNTAGGYCEMSIALSPGGKTLDKGTSCASGAGVIFTKYGGRFKADWNIISQGGRKPGLVYVQAQTTVRAVTSIDVTIGGATIPMSYTSATGWALAFVPSTLVRTGVHVTAYSTGHHVVQQVELGTPPPN